MGRVSFDAREWSLEPVCELGQAWQVGGHFSLGLWEASTLPVCECKCPQGAVSLGIHR